MATKPDHGKSSEQRRFNRAPLAVPFHMIPRGRAGDTIEGQTLDVSPTGLGVKLVRGRSGAVDELLETLVEERLPIEAMLRLTEGSVSAEGQLMWWGLLGDEDGFTIRAGILLPKGWSSADWLLIESNLKAS